MIQCVLERIVVDVRSSSPFSRTESSTGVSPGRGICLEAISVGCSQKELIRKTADVDATSFLVM